MFLSLSVVLFFWLRHDRIAFSGRSIRIEALLYASGANPTEETLEVAQFLCPRAGCIGPVVSQVLQQEFARHSGRKTQVRFLARAPRSTNLITIEPPGSLLEGVSLLLRLRSEFKKRGASFGRPHIRLFVNISRKNKNDKTEKSVGSARGHIGFVEWNSSAIPADRVWNVTKLLHEIGHTLGASDKYTITGKSVVPIGLVERRLGLKQRFVEIMSGTKPQGLGAELPAESYAELRFGDQSAIEMGWKTAARGN